MVTREYVRALKLKNVTEWREYYRSGRKPDDIPSAPEQAYKKQCKGYGDWLGTGTVANQNRAYRSFNEARKFIRSLGLKSYSDWINYCKTGKKPTYVPASPEVVYKNQWKGWGDWLGTGRLATKDIEFRSDIFASSSLKS